MRPYPIDDSCPVCGEARGLAHVHEDDRETREERLWEERQNR